MTGHAILNALPMALAIAFFPVPIIAMVIVLTSERARTSGTAFALGWLSGLIVLGGLVLTLADAADASDDGGPATWVSWTKIGLAAALLLLAWKQIRGAGTGTGGKEMPGWMSRMDSMRPAGAYGLGAALAAVNPKNVLLVVAGATEIAQAGLPAGHQVAAYGVFVVVATLGIGIPWVISLTSGSRSDAVLGSLKDWMTRHMAIIVAVLCTLIAAKLLWEGVHTLTS